MPQKKTPALSQAGGGPTQEQPVESVWQVCPPGQAPKLGGQVWGGEPGPHRGMVVVVQRLRGLVVLVVVVAAAGAQSSFGVLGVTTRLPN